jgi:electron transfer flavoprotein alpha subunit
MSTLGIYIELKDGKIKKTNLELLTMAQQAGLTPLAVLLADDPAGYVEELAAFGVGEIVHVSGLNGKSPGPEILARQLAEVIKEQGLSEFIATNSSQGKDLLPRVAARLEAPLASDCIRIDFADGVASKPMYAGKVIAQVKLTGSPRLFTVRPNTITPEAPAQGSTPEIKNFTAATETPLSEIKEIVKGVAGRIDLTEAQIIVSGGRGMKSKENFAILEKMADTLGAAVGASRAAVDSEFATQDIQVGQTGKTVNPVLYIACGISGAIQHFAGMKTSKVIVAINKDPEAPIFAKADFGIVGDLFEVVPVLTEELHKAMKSD